MVEKRRTKRTDMSSELVMKRLDGEEHSEITVEMLDVSREGIGFKCKEILGIGEVYECYLKIWTKEVIHACVQVVRSRMNAGEYIYGASFIGMPDVDAYRIEVYQTVNDND